jgi:hypothetical protein
VLTHNTLMAALISAFLAELSKPNNMATELQLVEIWVNQYNIIFD